MLRKLRFVISPVQVKRNVCPIFNGWDGSTKLELPPVHGELHDGLKTFLYLVIEEEFSKVAQTKIPLTYN